MPASVTLGLARGAFRGALGAFGRSLSAFLRFRSGATRGLLRLTFSSFRYPSDRFFGPTGRAIGLVAYLTLELESSGRREGAERALNFFANPFEKSGNKIV